MFWVFALPFYWSICKFEQHQQQKHIRKMMQKESKRQDWMKWMKKNDRIYLITINKRFDTFRSPFAMVFVQSLTIVPLYSLESIYICRFSILILFSLSPVYSNRKIYFSYPILMIYDFLPLLFVSLPISFSF